ncbi:hypothetical protein RJ639_035099 [Escallonia herrerae]|uniref:Germin-like protein n=1 Tax=Escallonia herrerae TaxID=1293975 RepID=A0AA88WP58_9ASTE|nr:hypothetical protein RJ639_035099 [Escallonia herrerae]
MAFQRKLLCTLALVVASLHVAAAGDPDILTDYVVPSTIVNLTSDLFTFTGMRVIINAPPPPAFKVLKASMAEFPGLNGQSVSYAVLQYPTGSVNPPHTHPRASELLFLLMGTLEVGFVDTTNKLYTQTLKQADMFVFPKGLVHYQYNADPKNPALALSAFGSASAGTVSIPNQVFNTSINDNILAKSFNTDIATIQKIKLGLRC